MNNAPGLARFPLRTMRGLALAVGFLTIFPIRWGGLQDLRLGQAAPWFPVVGAAVGAVAGLVGLAADGIDAEVGAVLAMLTLVITTGALHQDGLADCADAIGVRGDRTRRLQVMRESTLGAYGVLALIGWALLLFACLSAFDTGLRLEALVAACALARAAAVVHGASLPAARQDGLGSMFDAGRIAAVVAVIVAGAIAVLTVGAITAAIATAAVLVIVAVSVFTARRALGGRTGDTLGATVALTEIAACVAILAAS